MFVTEKLIADVEAFLSLLDSVSQWLMEHRDADLDSDLTLNLATQRALHLAVECVVDSANLIIDALVMREPASYADILQVIAEERIVTREWLKDFSPLLELRTALIRNYTTVTPGKVSNTLRSTVGLFAPFATAIRDYLRVGGS